VREKKKKEVEVIEGRRLTQLLRAVLFCLIVVLVVSNDGTAKNGSSPD
jgi:hypothetical protein